MPCGAHWKSRSIGNWFMYDKTKLKKQWEDLLGPAFGFFSDLGIRPTQITISGAAFVLSGCILLLNHQLILAFIAFVMGGLCDTLDGAYARATGQVTVFGGFCDSVIDRYNEFILVGCVLFYTQENELLYFFSFIFFLGIALMSYTRVLFEKNDFYCPANPFEYLERGLLFLMFFVFGRLDLWLIVIAIGTHGFVIHRCFMFYRLTKAKS